MMKKISFEKSFRRLLAGGAVFCSLLAVSPLGAVNLQLTRANTMAGGYLFDKIPLWKLTPENFAKRNKLKLNIMPGQGGTSTASVFMKRKAKWFGVPVEELKINSADGKITGITFVLFNKGDSVKSGSKKSALSKELQRQERMLIKHLNSYLGAGSYKFFGINKRRCRVWYCREAALVLESVDREYMQLYVVPSAQVSGRKIKQDKHEIKRKEFEKTADLVRTELGDVYIKRVPMVDQGSKGYCVPATLERCFRYFGVNDVDMHRIADLGKTKLSGGTDVRKALSGINQLLSNYGLRYEECGGLQMSQLTKHIDAGYPLLWTMYSSKGYLTQLKVLNEARAKVPDPVKWCKILKKRKKLKKSKEGSHVCLIIGYNRKTDEIAVSNSWGRSGEIAWVPFRDALIADQKESLYVIKPR